MRLEGIQVLLLNLHTLRRMTFENKHPILSSSEQAVKHRVGEDKSGKVSSLHLSLHPTFPVGGFKGSLVHARISLCAQLMLCLSELLLCLLCAAPAALRALPSP